MTSMRTGEDGRLEQLDELVDFDQESNGDFELRAADPGTGKRQQKEPESLR